MTDIITTSTSFKSKMKSTSISQFKASMDLYSTNFNDALQLKNDTPIFLDTNILLRYYSISFNAREKLFKFIADNISRIYLSEQVQFEFLKNREDVIGKFFEQVTNKIPKDFTQDILNKIKNFNDQHKVVLKDYPYVEPELKSSIEKLSKTLENLN